MAVCDVLLLPKVEKTVVPPVITVSGLSINYFCRLETMYM